MINLFIMDSKIYSERLVLLLVLVCLNNFRSLVYALNNVGHF